MKALFDPNRVIVLRHRSLCVCEIKGVLGIAQSTAGKHLRILEDADLVKSIKDGLWSYYSLYSGCESPFAARMIGNLLQLSRPRGVRWFGADQEAVR